MHSIDPSLTFCIALQNPNGIRPFHTDIDFKYSLARCSSFGIGALAIVETKLNWNHPGSLRNTKHCFHQPGNIQYYNHLKEVKHIPPTSNLAVPSQQ
jgi:hypothetical protein